MRCTWPWKIVWSLLRHCPWQRCTHADDANFSETAHQSWTPPPRPMETPLPASYLDKQRLLELGPGFPRLQKANFRPRPPRYAGTQRRRGSARATQARPSRPCGDGAELVYSPPLAHHGWRGAAHRPGAADGAGVECTVGVLSPVALIRKARGPVSGTCEK
jgi:hypothetical protein